MDRGVVVREEEDAPLEGREPPLVAEPIPPSGSGEGPDQRPVTVDQIVDALEDAGDRAKEVLGDVGTSVRRLVDRGRYRKVRISRKGKQLLPDIPVAAVAAIEAASMVGAGVARVLAVNLGAKLFFDVDVINEADKFVEAGKAALLDGDLDRAKEQLEKAVRIDDTHPEAYLELGVINRLRGDLETARENLEDAKRLDETGPTGKRAAEILKSMGAHG